MAVNRLNIDSDATWARAWVCDTTAERTALLATFGAPLGPKRGDMILDNEIGQVFIVTNGGSDTQLTGLADSPIDLTSDVTGVLPTANGGTSVNIASAALPLGSGQITFPATANPSGNANTLDDYEEGSWTPVLDGLGGVTGQSYSSQVGTYIRVGQLVLVGARIILTNKGTITGAIIISGLPFAAQNTSGATQGAPVPYFADMATTFCSLGGIMQQNGTFAVLFGIKVAAQVSSVALDTNDITNTTDMVITIAYRAET